MVHQHINSLLGLCKKIVSLLKIHVKYFWMKTDVCWNSQIRDKPKINYMYVLSLYLIQYITGEVNFNADIVRMIEKSSEGRKSTYAYYYTQLRSVPQLTLGLQAPDFLRQSADHGEELSIVWGGPGLSKQPNSVWLGKMLNIYIAYLFW